MTCTTSRTYLEAYSTVEQVAARLGESASTVWRRIRRGEIATERMLGRVLVPRAEVDRVVHGRARGAR